MCVVVGVCVSLLRRVFVRSCLVFFVVCKSWIEDLTRRLVVSDYNYGV